MGFKQGVASPCCFHHEAWQISLLVHGDDFVALGVDDSLSKYEAGMQKAFEVKLQGRIGPEPGDLQEARILNRIIRMTPQGMTYEADPRHVEMLARDLELTDKSKSVATPGVKGEFDEHDVYDLEDSVTSMEEIVAPVRVRTVKIIYMMSSSTHKRRFIKPFRIHNNMVPVPASYVSCLVMALMWNQWQPRRTETNSLASPRR